VARFRAIARQLVVGMLIAVCVTDLPGQPDRDGAPILSEASPQTHDSASPLPIAWRISSTVCATVISGGSGSYTRRHSSAMIQAVLSEYAARTVGGFLNDGDAAKNFIGSIGTDAQRFANAVRSHWGVENNPHWSLDIALREDHSRLHERTAAQNAAVLSHIALALLKNDTGSKLGIKNKRLKAG